MAGTTVYEERRAESLKIMQETANKQEQITEVRPWPTHTLCPLPLARPYTLPSAPGSPIHTSPPPPAKVLNFIEERLGELEKEKEELSEYEQLDKHRRALEYNLYVLCSSNWRPCCYFR